MRFNQLGFKLTSFRLDRTISQRRFSITEAALLLMSANYFNALFGTGPQANAFYAAAQLPDTLFNLIAGGALTYAFIPVFISHEKENGAREAWRLASLVFNVLLVVLTALALLGEWLAPTFVNHLLVPGYPLPNRHSSQR